MQTKVIVALLAVAHVKDTSMMVAEPAKSAMPAAVPTSVEAMRWVVMRETALPLHLCKSCKGGDCIQVWMSSCPLLDGWRSTGCMSIGLVAVVAVVVKD